MDRRVGDYLCARIAGPVAHTEKKQSLFILETRDSYWLERVLCDARASFPEWDCYVAAPPNLLASLRRRSTPVPGATPVKEIAIDLPPACSPATFSAVMFSPQLWHIFQTEFVMIFQTDSVFAPRAASKLPAVLDKDFYGAACGDLAGDYVINGGLSLRRVSAFARAVALLTDEDRALPEDVAFCRVMRRHPADFALPSVSECMTFAIESFGDPSSVVGIHGTDKYYAPPALIAAALGNPAKKHFVVDAFTYDGEPILETRLKVLGECVDLFVVCEARFTHAGEPKPLYFDPAKYEKWAHKIRYLVVDEFPPAPADFGKGLPWVRDNAEAWWREKYQRDFLVCGIPDDALCIISDVDEIPDPSVLDTLNVEAGPVWLDMAFLVYSPVWQKHEEWTRAFACLARDLGSPTDMRCARPARIAKAAGWHCSSFFDVERQIQKIRSFAHREFADQTDPDVIRARFELGRDPYGRGPQYDCFKTNEHIWLHYV